jgi:uncharacterized protein (TIGR03067 family)
MKHVATGGVILTRPLSSGGHVMFASFVALSLLVVSADPPKEKEKPKELSAEAKKELKKLEGKWRLVKALNAAKEEEAKDVEIFFAFEGSKVTLSSGNKDKKETLEVTAIDASTDPKCIDLKEERAGKPSRTLECVYKIDGEMLQFAMAVPPEGEKLRPTGFDKPASPRVMVWTLKRVKE